jgi:hypothetical protein
MKKSKGFVYKERSAKSVEERAEQTGGRFDSIFKSGFDSWKPKVGDNLIRILPPTWEDHEHYGLDVWLHSYVGVNNGSYLCLSKMKNKPCPICQAAKASKDAGEDEEADHLQPSRRVVCWIIDRDADKPVPELYSMSWSMDRDIAALCHDKRKGKVLLIDHPDEGYDVTIKRKGTTKTNTKYFGIAVDRDPTSIGDDSDEQQEILDFITENPVPSVLNYYSADKLEEIMAGTAEEKDEELDEKEGEDVVDEETGEITKKKTHRRDEEEEEERPRRKASRDEEEEEESKPRRRSTRDAEEEEEEEKPRRKRPQEEEEEEEAPLKSRRRSRDEEETEESEDEPRGHRANRRPVREPETEEEQEEMEAQSTKRRRQEPEEEEEEKPRRRASRDEEEEEERPSRRVQAIKRVGRKADEDEEE